MNYKYQRRQIFGKRLDVPSYIKKKVYNRTLSFKEYIEYQLDDKIPISCIVESDRRIVERFGIDKCKELDWELINKKITNDMQNSNYTNSIENVDIKELLMSIDFQEGDINYVLYELVKNRISPENYSEKMKEKYPDKFFNISEEDRYDVLSIENRFNMGNISLKEIIDNWNLLMNKDLTYCLLRDKHNINNITDRELKEFMDNYANLLHFIYDYGDIYIFIKEISNLTNIEEKNNYVREFTDNILKNTYKNNHDKESYIKLTNDEFKELFKYSSMEEYLNKICSFAYSLIEELNNLPPNYIFNTFIPFSEITNNYILHFVSRFGIKNIVEFNNENNQFFEKDNFRYIESLERWLREDFNILGPYKKKQTYEITTEDFYQIMRIIIENYAFIRKDLKGKFESINNDLYISESAPEELKDLFYSNLLTPRLLLEHPDFVNFLDKEKILNGMKSINIKAVNNKNLYEYLIDIVDFKEFLEFITEYSGILEILNSNIKLLGENITEIQDELNRKVRDLIIRDEIAYPNHIPKSLIEKYPSMFLAKNAPQELQEAFYSRTITSEFILSNPAYRDYLNSVDLECLFKYMPVGIMPKSSSNNLSISGPLGHRTRYHQINFVNALKETFGESDALDLMLIYGKYVEQVYEANNLKNFLYNPEFTQDGFLDELDKTILQNIIDGNMKYDESIPSHFKNNNPTLFLGADVPQEIKDKFYNREFTLKDFNDNPELFNIFENTNIACAFSENMSWIIPLFNDSENFKTGNYNRMKVISAYSKIQDVELQKAFKEYVKEFGTNIDVEKIEYVSEVLSRLSLSNSSEIFTFRKELATQILKSNNPLESLSKIEDVFIRNNIPTVGKIYSCFEILHPDFQGFNFESSMISPVLKKSSTMSKKVTVFSDLIKSSFGSNNRSVNAYLKNIEFGSNLYESIKSGQIQFDSLGETEIKELNTFCSHLATLYNNTMKAKKSNETFKSTGYVLTDILELSKKLSPDGTLDYNLADRVIRMFCGFTGIDTLEQAKEYIERKVKTADSRNRNASSSDMVLEQGDFIKGIGGITYLRNILQNGSVSKEYLGSSAGSDATPIDTDISMIMSSDGTISEKMGATAASGYGPIWFVLKNDDRFITTRTSSETLEAKRDMSKMEVFYTGVLGQGHYGIRTGFASSEINYIVMDNYDPKVGLEIAMNGFYIPVANKEGKIVFTPKDYDELRTKMSGLSYYDENNYTFSENLITEETEYFAEQIEQSNFEVQAKREKINNVIKKSLEELGLHLKTNIDGDLTEGFVELIDTGSTGRGTNKPGDGDFDFMMRLDKTILSNPTRLSELKQTILRNLGRENSSELTGTGDFRLKGVPIDTDMSVDIDITFTEKTDKVAYSTDMALQDRLATIQRNDPEKYKYVVANILLAKQVLKKAEAYKPNRGEIPQGGLGGVGIENWILQNGGSFIDAARSFVEASDGKSFSEFQSTYQIWDFGDNHLAERRGQYAHDNFIANNMSEAGYQKMVAALKEYLKSMELAQTDTEIIKR